MFIDISTVLPEDKINVKKNFSSKGITPTTKEEGAKNRKEMINNALIDLNN